MATLQSGIQGKICSGCGEWKPLSEYFKDRTHGPSQGGRHCRYRRCDSAYHEAHRALHRGLRVAVVNVGRQRDRQRRSRPA